MRILFVSTLYSDSDQPSDRHVRTTALRSLVKHWRETDEVCVIRPAFNRDALHGFDDSPGLINARGVRILGLELYLLNSGALARQLPFKPDVVVAHMFKSFLWAWRLSNSFDVPFVAGIHQSDIRLLPVPYLGRRLHSALNRAQGIATRSPALQKRLLKRSPEYRTKAFLAMSGVDTLLDNLEQEACERVRRWKATGHIRLATAGRLAREKRIDVTLRALARLPAEASWEFSIIGDGPLRSNLESLTEQLGLQGKVRFLGWQSKPEVIDSLSAADVFVLVSAPETLGLVFLEAMAAGALVIGARNWGVDGVVNDGENGFLCDAGDVGSLESALSRLWIEHSEEYLAGVALRSARTIAGHTEKRAAESYRQQLLRIVDEHQRPQTVKNDFVKT